MKGILSKTLVFLFVLVVGVGGTASSHAQNVGVGAHIGEPTGVTLKFHSAGGPSYDFLGAWSLQNDELFLNAHLLFENRISADNVDRPLEWFVGPGGFLILMDDPSIGASGTIGLNLILTDHISIYGRLTPRFALTPETGVDLGGGIGIRFFF